MCKAFMQNLLGMSSDAQTPAAAQATEYEAGAEVRDKPDETGTDPTRRGGNNIAGVVDGRRRRGALAGLGL